MFGDPEAPLPDFMRRIQVLAAAGIAQTPDEILSKAFAKLGKNHIAFGIQSLAQSWVHQPKCGHGVESFYDPPGAAKVAAKIKAAAGDLVYVAMDEPLWFGHYYVGRDACRSSLQNVAERAAAIMLEYKKLFPDVIIGDIEPFPSLTDQPNWQNDYKEWMQAFSAAMGQPLAFVHIDINWSKPGWQASVQQTVALAKTVQLPVGIIYNGNVHGDPSPTTRKWLDAGVQNFTLIETQLGVVPDQVIFHSWEKYPAHSITDKSDLGEDYLVQQYIKLRGVGSRKPTKTVPK